MRDGSHSIQQGEVYKIFFIRKSLQSLKLKGVTAAAGMKNGQKCRRAPHLAVTLLQTFISAEGFSFLPPSRARKQARFHSFHFIIKGLVIFLHSPSDQQATAWL